jgi:hypothetical protein
VLVVATIVFAGFMFWVLPNEAARFQVKLGGVPSPDTSLVYSACDLYAMASAYGSEGRAYYVRSRFTFDVAWPLAYTLFLTSALTILFGRLKLSPGIMLVNLLPLAGAVFDFVENISASVVMYRYPESSNIFASMAPIATFLKWSFIGLSFAGFVVGVVLVVGQGVRSKRTT